MGLLFKKYKTKFRYALKPFFAMLLAKETQMTKEEWNAKIIKTHQRIVENPVDFLGPDLPEKDLQKDILDEIFKDFFKDLRIKRR